MKLALIGINAKYIHSNLAIYDLAAYAYKDYGPHLVIGEYTINQPREQILKGLFQMEAGVYCFSCYLWNIDFIKTLTADLKQIRPDAHIYLGGPEVSYQAQKLLTEMEQIDGVISGEGEVPFHELCRSYIEGLPQILPSIGGLSYRDSSGAIRVNDPGAPFDLSSLPFCYEVLPNLDLEHRIIYYESSRGCPFNCSYCLSSVEKQVRYRSLDQVFHELQYFIDHRIPQIKFVDRTFNCDHKRTLAIWQYMIDHDLGITNFHCEIAAEILTDQEIDLLNSMRPGLVQLEIGVQTTNPDTLKEIHRPSDFSHLKSIVERLQAPANIHCHLDLIAGLPYEDIDSFRSSFNNVYSLQPNQLQLGFLKLLKGSYMDLHHKDYDCLASNHAPFEVLSTRWITYQELLVLKGVEEMTEVYYNSGQFTHTLPYLVDFWESPYDFFLDLSRYYETQGYYELAHNRVRRYEILLEFCREKISADCDFDLLLGHLTMDLYLRENLKKRPDWLPDLKPYMKDIKEYCRLHDLTLDHMHHMEIINDKWYWFDYSDRDKLSNNVKVKKINFSG